MHILNPLHAPPAVATSNQEETREDRNKTADVIEVGKRMWPASSSTPSQRPLDTSAFSVASLKDSLVRLDHEPADMIVNNPLFGSGVDFNQVRQYNTPLAMCYGFHCDTHPTSWLNCPSPQLACSSRSLCFPQLLLCTAYASYSRHIQDG